MSFAIYVVGALIMIGGLVYGANLLHVPDRWVIVGVMVLFGASILAGVKGTRQKDPPAS
jgi:hypothetical protein